MIYLFDFAPSYLFGPLHFFEPSYLFHHGRFPHNPLELLAPNRPSFPVCPSFRSFRQGPCQSSTTGTSYRQRKHLCSTEHHSSEYQYRSRVSISCPTAPLLQLTTYQTLCLCPSRCPHSRIGRYSRHNGPCQLRYSGSGSHPCWWNHWCCDSSCIRNTANCTCLHHLLNT